VLERRERGARGEHPAAEQIDWRRLLVGGRRQLADLEEGGALRWLGRRRLAAGAGHDLEPAEVGRDAERGADRRDPGGDLIEALEHRQPVRDGRTLGAGAGAGERQRQDRGRGRGQPLPGLADFGTELPDHGLPSNDVLPQALALQQRNARRQPLLGRPLLDFDGLFPLDPHATLL